MDNSFAARGKSNAATDSAADFSEFYLAALKGHSFPGQNRAEKLELVAARDSTKAAPERVIDIENVGNIIGWWQKQQYEDLHVQRIRLGPDTVALELSSPVQRRQLFTTLDLDKRFSFKFSKNDHGWTLNNVNGLKVDGDPINKVTASENGIKFYYAGGTHNYGKGVADYIKALFNPLMEERLRSY